MNIIAVLFSAIARVAVVPVIVLSVLVATGQVETLVDNYQTITGMFDTINEGLKIKP